MKRQLNEGEETKSNRLLFDTCANKSLLISLNSFKTYCKEFHVPTRLDKSDSKSIFVIGGTTKSVGTSIVPVPFKDLNMVINVNL